MPQTKRKPAKKVVRKTVKRTPRKAPAIVPEKHGPDFQTPENAAAIEREVEALEARTEAYESEQNSMNGMELCGQSRKFLNTRKAALVS